jgi:hypothetical protein
MRTWTDGQTGRRSRVAIASTRRVWYAVAVSRRARSTRVGWRPCAEDSFHATEYAARRRRDTRPDLTAHCERKQSGGRTRRHDEESVTAAAAREADVSNAFERRQGHEGRCVTTRVDWDHPAVVVRFHGKQSFRITRIMRRLWILTSLGFYSCERCQFKVQPVLISHRFLEFADLGSKVH